MYRHLCIPNDETVKFFLKRVIPFIKIFNDFKHMKILPFIILILCTLISCKNKQKNVNIEHISSKEVKILFSDKKCPVSKFERILLYNDYLIVTHSSSKQNYTIMDKHTGNVLAEWGTYGHGDSEFLDFGTQFSIVDSTIYFMENSTFNFCSVSLSDIINKKKDIIVSKVHYPRNNDFFPISFCKLKDISILMGGFKDYRFGVIDNEMKQIRHDVNDYPFDTGIAEGSERGLVYQGFMCANKELDKVAIITFASDALEIYQFEKSMPKLNCSVKPTYIPDAIEVYGRKTLNLNDSKCGFINVASSNKYLYVLYSESSYFDFRNKDNFTSYNILCYDWDGNEICKIDLPVSVSAIAVDDKYIYGIGQKNAENVIYKIKNTVG